MAGIIPEWFSFAIQFKNFLLLPAVIEFKHLYLLAAWYNRL